MLQNFPAFQPGLQVINCPRLKLLRRSHHGKKNYTLTMEELKPKIFT